MFLVYESVQVTRQTPEEVHFARLKFIAAHKKEKDALADMERLRGDNNRVVVLKLDAKALRATNWQVVTKLEIPSGERLYLPLKKLLYFMYDGDQLKVHCADNAFVGVPYLG